MEESLRKVHTWLCIRVCAAISHFARRRNAQLSCGFHGTQHKPYHDVGKVTLDDKNLFVEGLGQSNVLEQVSNMHLLKKCARVSRRLIISIIVCL